MAPCLGCSFYKAVVAAALTVHLSVSGYTGKDLTQ